MNLKLTSQQDAKLWLERFATIRRAQDRFIERMAEGGRSAPLREFWTGDEANRLFSQACEELGVSVAEVEDLEATNHDDLRRALLQAGELLGVTGEGLRRLESMVESVVH